MPEKRSFSFPLIGISSLLVIFSVLCLTVFALLCVSTVRADQALSLRSAEAIAAYYEADFAAEEILAQLREGQLPPEVQEENGFYWYTCPISDTQTLYVELAVNGYDYTVLRWQAVSTADWQPDDRLPVWNVEEGA